MKHHLDAPGEGADMFHQIFLVAAFFDEPDESAAYGKKRNWASRYFYMSGSIIMLFSLS